jgi:hypothetical protein
MANSSIDSQYTIVNDPNDIIFLESVNKEKISNKVYYFLTNHTKEYVSGYLYINSSGQYKFVSLTNDIRYLNMQFPGSLYLKKGDSKLEKRVDDLEKRVDDLEKRVDPEKK